MRREIVLDVWGDFACFSRPESRVERLTYPVPTPSAMRGVLSAVYSKPGEFYWQVNRIEVLKKISYVSFKRNEVKNRESEKKPLMVEEERTQRQTVALRDVKYRVHASIVKRREFDEGRGTVSAGASAHTQRKVLFSAVLGLAGICRIL